MGLFLLGTVASLFLGRIFCGWICPINTVMNAVTWIKKKLHIKSLKMPPFLSKSWVRFIALGLFIAAFIFIMVSGNKLPVLPILFVLGILTTLFFPEELWHRYLCPFGIILNYPATMSKHTMLIDATQCNNCGVCKAVCPAKAVERYEKHHITKGYCLVCMKCSNSCNKNAISYK
jgi:polyferredoxin